MKNDTDWHKGGGGGPKMSKKLTRIIWMAPKHNYKCIKNKNILSSGF